MPTLAVTERNNILVIDSRLIAHTLDIQHKNFLASVEKYEEEAVAEGFSPLAFETRLVKRPQGGTYEERWAWLDEEWTNYAMTLSRNTPEVRAAKRGLVKAFSNARKQLNQVGQALAYKDAEVELSESTNKLVDEFLDLVIEVCWESQDRINNIQAETIQEQKRLKAAFLKGLDRKRLYSLAKQAVGRIGHNAMHQHQGMAKIAVERAEPYREKMVVKLQSLQRRLIASSLSVEGSTTMIRVRPKEDRAKIEQFLDELQQMSPQERLGLLTTVPSLTTLELRNGRWSSRLVARRLGLLENQYKTVQNIMRERDWSL